MFPEAAALDINGYYHFPGFTYNDDLLIFNHKFKAMNVVENEVFQIWYGEDLKDRYESDNEGKHCVDVDISCLI